MLESVLQNLINIGWAMLIFLAAYLANVAFSLWYNIKILHESFDKDKLIASGLKILTSSRTSLLSAPCCSWPASTSRRPLLSSWLS